MDKETADKIIEWITTNGEWRREDPKGGKFDNPVHWYLKSGDVVRFISSLVGDFDPSLSTMPCTHYWQFKDKLYLLYKCNLFIHCPCYTKQWECDEYKPKELHG